MEFPVLYKMNTQGTKWMTWKVSVLKKEGKCIIKRVHGYEDGKTTSSEKEITKGKNIGKKNETSMYQQACNDATSMWTKQKEIQKYCESKTEVTVRPQPMLAHSFDKQFTKIKYPCFTQPKLDGVRMVCNGSVCISRTGKEFSLEPLQYIIKEINMIINEHPQMKDYYFDGELYTPDLMFEDIVGACRTNIKPDETKYKLLKYHVYDIIPVSSTNKNQTFSERHDVLKSILKESLSFIKMVKSDVAQSKEEIFDKHDEYLSSQYEGIIIRNFHGMYQQSRSYNLQKYKHFTDEEYEIVDIKEATGNDTGTAILQCKTKDDLTFWVRPKGSREYRTSLLVNSNDVMNKMLTVRYQNLTDRGLPRFPVGITIRDYE
jgi:DNA ligase-1